MLIAKFSHISGDRVLDLINTVEWRLGGPQREEDLTSYSLMLTWCQESGVIDASEQNLLLALAEKNPRSAANELDKVITLRENAYEALFHGDAAAATALAAAYRKAIAAATLVRGESGTSWAWEDQTTALDLPRHRITRGLIELLKRDDLDRLHQCEDATCGWVYLDTSPRRNRRWCVTRDCGDRNRSRAYYARQQARKQTT
ncbi:putative RNA-binding Zn ribbon-like protein [Yimella lutea]|uniref:Putative RNA-binding Zn ribbon-like protein n=1 Tax=Yimella lutea TaxID=587872 RepID=A0A542EDB6_9MICO|nr:CGNR zinc finger domain-containing protein [Yimella lutea]TQJ13321.1 putative RNA-binding Zn ribbon-like protein [Yimella lutea]